jgi:hypothetical protein
MSEFECPHCGEPIDGEANACPYCGSDGETGWSSDIDYYSVDLPDDDSEWSSEEPGSRGQTWSERSNDREDRASHHLLAGGSFSVTRGGTGGIALLTAAFVAFLIAGYQAWGGAALLAAIVLLVSFGSARALRKR